MTPSTSQSATSKSRDHVLTYPVDLFSEKEATEVIRAAWKDSLPLHVVTLNAEMVVASQKDAELDRIIRGAELIVPDGAGVVWALKLSRAENGSVKRLPGIELASAALSAAAKEGQTVALVGGRPEVMNKLVDELPRLHPGLKIIAHQNGYYDLDKERDTVLQLAANTPRLVLVALGVPRQEYFIDRWKSEFPRSVMIGVGGSFDVWTGFVQRAPLSFQKYHCEWLYRLLKEPWRFNRMAKSLPNFALQAGGEIFARRLGQKK